MVSFQKIVPVSKDGSVTIVGVPFQPGQWVEVIARECMPDPSNYPLWGTVRRYDEPTEHVAEKDWEALG